MTSWRLCAASSVTAFGMLVTETPDVPLLAQAPSPQVRGGSAPASIAELWSPPKDIASRDLFLGHGGASQVPTKDAAYEVIGYDRTGYSAGYEVRDEQGREWDVKLGAEAQPELVASRVLWAIGYHQASMHFVSSWRKKGEKTATEPSARFRLRSAHDSKGEWAWSDNPFVGSRELRGLVVANLVLNNWDLKDSNNRIYEITANAPGPRRWFVVQDLGASLGRSGFPVGSRNDIDDFEGQNLIAASEGGTIDFDYGGRHRDLLKGITANDVSWVCGLLAQLTDAQWADAFRAATYPPDTARRYITKLKSKVAEGVAVGTRGRKGQP